MKTLILGSGGVGSIIGGYLAAGGRDVTIADGWFQHVESIRENGLRLEAVEGDFTVDVPAIHLDELTDYDTADVIVIASKSYDTHLMALLAREHAGPGTVIMSAQNGMNDPTVQEVLGRDRVVGCVVAFAADLHTAGTSRRATPLDSGSIIIGDLVADGDHARLERLLEHFEPLGGVRIADDIWPERWGKLTLNSMSNAMAGLTASMSTNLWSQPETLDAIIALGHETASVANRAGVDMKPVLGRIPHEVWLAADSITSSAWAKITSHMQAVGAERVGKRANRASLLQDIQKGRRTEIDYLNGWVHRRGGQLGVETRTHALIVDELHSVERGERPAALANAKAMIDSVREWYA